MPPSGCQKAVGSRKHDQRYWSEPCNKSEHYHRNNRDLHEQRWAQRSILRLVLRLLFHSGNKWDNFQKMSNKFQNNHLCASEQAFIAAYVRPIYRDQTENAGLRFAYYSRMKVVIWQRRLSDLKEGGLQYATFAGYLGEQEE